MLIEPDDGRNRRLTEDTTDLS